MKKYLIYLNYEMDKLPIGYVVLYESVPEDIVREGAIVPYLRKEEHEVGFQTTAFGLVPRTTVDTNPREL